MTRSSRLAAAALIACAILSGCASRSTLRSFGSERELLRYHRALVEAEGAHPVPTVVPAPPPPVMAAPPSTPGQQPPVVQPQIPADAPSVALEEVTVAGHAAGVNVTNVQHAGVDEGGIVKVHGDYLVMLRRGRLFTVRIGGGALDPVAAVDAFGPGIDPQHAWYDELLVADSTVLVIGFSYERGGTEVGMFRIGADGSLAHRATYQLRSYDYYSSRNYASRLVGGRLVFYAPIPVDEYEEDATEVFPAFRRWGDGDTTFRRTASARRVYRPAVPLTLHDYPMLHTITVCELGADTMDCRSTALYGPESRVSYVSPSAVYVWATRYPVDEETSEETAESFLYRMPLDGSAPRGIRTTGVPVDQFSFLESGDRHLNVLVGSEGYGESMWGSEWREGEPALLRLPLRALGDGSRTAPDSLYRRLPMQEGGYNLQNRFVGEWLLYGAEMGYTGSAAEKERGLHAVRWTRREDAVWMPFAHGVDRIEALGSGAVVVGSDGEDLHFNTVRLGERAEPVHDFVRPNASQGETRSHGFFYRPDGAEEGVLGLPVRGPADPRYASLREGSAAVLFLRNQAFRLSELGDLAAGPLAEENDVCRVSCVDWYGNARPLFVRERVFALLGYEIVEGALQDGRIREVRRVTYAPKAVAPPSGQ